MLAEVIVLAVGVCLLVQGIRMKGEKGDRNIALLMVVCFVIRSLLVVGSKLLGFDEDQLGKR